MKKVRITGWGTIVRWSNKCRNCPNLKHRTYCSHLYHNCQNWTNCSTYEKNPSAQTPHLHHQASTLSPNNSKLLNFKRARRRFLSRWNKSSMTANFLRKRTWTQESSWWTTGKHYDYRISRKGRKFCWGRRDLRPYAVSWICCGSGRGSSWSTVWTIGTISKRTSRRSYLSYSRYLSYKSTDTCSKRLLPTRAVRINKTVTMVIIIRLGTSIWLTVAVKTMWTT